MFSRKVENTYTPWLSSKRLILSLTFVFCLWKDCHVKMIWLSLMVLSFPNCLTHSWSLLPQSSSVKIFSMEGFKFRFLYFYYANDYLLRNSAVLSTNPYAPSYLLKELICKNCFMSLLLFPSQDISRVHVQTQEYQPKESFWCHHRHWIQRKYTWKS